MLTFEFSGVEGKMTQVDVLTSGMVGREIAITLDESWDALYKTVVFRAGEVCRTAALEADTVVVPAEVLARPFTRLFVGVYGTDENGELVVPTIMAEGPYVRYGADPIEDPIADELPVWQRLQNQIGDLTQLETLEKDSLVGALNELEFAVSELRFNSTAASLLITILSHALYDCNMSATISALEAALIPEADDSGDCGESLFTVTNSLTNVQNSNPASTAAQGSSYSAVLTADDGYAIESVAVTVGGEDVTETVWDAAAGTVTIAAVTADIVILAVAGATAADVQKETLEIIPAASYPNTTTFEYTEGSSGQYVVAKQSSIAGGLVTVSYGPDIYNNFAFNFYVFDADGNPLKHTGSTSAWGETNSITWNAPGSGAGFGCASAPFTVQMDEGCTFIVCMRRNATGVTSTGSGLTGTPGNGDFVTWATSGGIVITVEG